MINTSQFLELAKKLALASHSISVWCESTRDKTFPWTSTDCNWEFEETRRCTMLEF